MPRGIRRLSLTLSRLRDVARFDATDEVYLTLDRDGVLSCFGNDTEGVCGPPGQGVAKSDGPVRVPLDGPLDGS